MRYLTLFLFPMVLALLFGLAGAFAPPRTLPGPGSSSGAKTPVELLIGLAEGGKVSAQLLLAEHYLRGDRVPADPERARAWYRRAAEGGSTEASRRLGFMYETGLGGVADPTLAAYWYARAGTGNEPWPRSIVTLP